MEAIGRILAYVLLAAAFTKNMFATSTANIKFSRDKIVLCNATKPELIPEPASLNLDIGNLRSILVNAFKSELIQGVEHNFISTFINKKALEEIEL